MQSAIPGNCDLKCTNAIPNVLKCDPKRYYNGIWNCNLEFVNFSDGILVPFQIAFLYIWDCILVHFGSQFSTFGIAC